MKLGYTQVWRKLGTKFGVQGKDVYVLNKDGKLVAKRTEKQEIQFFVNTPDGVKLLVLVKGLKRKIDQNLNVTTVVTLFDFDAKNLVKVVKNRMFKLETDDMLKTHQICVLGTAEEKNDGLHVVCDELGIDEVLTECSVLEDGQVIYIISEKEKAIKGEKKE